MIMVSACLCGVNCKYDNGNNSIKEIEDLLEKKQVLLICPEQLGGLETPRIPSEIVGGTGKDVLNGCAKVLDRKNHDVTQCFLKGAKEVLRLAQKIKPDFVILKAKSPSCGKNIIYDGTFKRTIKQGNGVTAEILIENGFKVVTEDEYLNNVK